MSRFHCSLRLSVGHQACDLFAHPSPTLGPLPPESFVSTRHSSLISTWGITVECGSSSLAPLSHSMGNTVCTFSLHRSSVCKPCRGRSPFNSYTHQSNSLHNRKMYTTLTPGSKESTAVTVNKREILVSLPLLQSLDLPWQAFGGPSAHCDPQRRGRSVAYTSTKQEDNRTQIYSETKTTGKSMR